MVINKSHSYHFISKKLEYSYFFIFFILLGFRFCDIKCIADDILSINPIQKKYFANVNTFKKIQLGCFATGAITYTPLGNKLFRNMIDKNIFRGICLVAISMAEYYKMANYIFFNQYRASGLLVSQNNK